MKNHVLLAGHGEARDLLREIGSTLKQRGCAVSGYYNNDIGNVTGDTLRQAQFLLIGLSRIVRQVRSDEYSRELAFLERVHAVSPTFPCGVMSDCDGNTGAQYLATYGSMMRVVVSDDLKVASVGVFGTFTRIPKNPDAVANAIHDLLRNGVLSPA